MRQIWPTMPAWGELTLRFGLLALLCAAASGCWSIPFTDKQGTTHHLIIGLGVVSVAKPKGETAVQVVRVQALGLALSEQPGVGFSLGWISNTAVSFREGGSFAQVSISREIGGPMTISAGSVRPIDTLKRIWENRR